MIPLLVKSQARFAIRHPVGPTASFVGVVLAVLAIVTVHVVSQSIRAGLDDPTVGGHTHVVSAQTLDEADYFELRRRWRSGDDPLRGIQAMFPVIEGFVSVRGQPRRIMGFDPLAVCVECDIKDGGSQRGWRPGGEGEPYDGTKLTRYLVDDVVIVSPATAVDIAADGGTIAGTPVTLVESDTSIIMADLPTAQRLLGRQQQLDAIWIRTAGVRPSLLDWVDGLLPGIAASLPRYADPVIDGYTVTARSRWNPSRRFADAIVFNLGMLSLLCLLMAAFIAFQASVSNAARRRTEQERLLALGASRGALHLTACAEGLIIGVLGSVAGMALGMLLADTLLQSAGVGAAALLGSGASLDAWVVGKSLVCGVLVSVLGPLVVRGDRPSRPLLRVVIGLVAALVAVASLASGSLAAAFVALFAVCLVQVVHVVPAAGAAVRRLAAFGRSLSTRSGLRAAAVRSGEIRLALGALSIAVAVAIGMDLMVESLRRDFAAMLDVRLWEGISVSVTDDLDTTGLAELPGAREIRRYGDFRARIEQGPVDVRVARLDAAETARYGFDGPLSHRVMLNEVGARLFDLEPGDTVVIASAGSRLAVRVAHVFRDFGAPAPRIIVPDAFLSSFESTTIGWRRASVLADPEALPRLTAVLSERFGVDRVSDRSAVRELAMAVFDRTFVVSRSLTSVALFVAALGLYAALTALQASRAPEFRLLSAVGHSRAGLWRLGMSEAVALGGIAVGAAVPLGFVVAWVLCDFVNPAAFGWTIDLRVVPSSVVVPVLVGLGGAVAAGAVPAYRASFRGEV
ncbi:MAG: FtsX-like permease family protein [Gammaproteobacteria bacterium]|nr:FtsX-like permease family protein [Gammaproteobacteria bacterium]